jgi:hypothetical protein
LYETYGESPMKCTGWCQSGVSVRGCAGPGHEERRALPVVRGSIRINPLPLIVMLP